jgi:hypothetical protein
MPGVSHAGCSNLIGQVVFNEINHHNQSCDYSFTHDAFVELRSLNNQVIVDNSAFLDFTLTVCAVYPQVEDDDNKARCYSGNPAVGYGTGGNGATGTNPEIIYQPAMTYGNAENSGNPWIVLYGDGGKIPKCYLDVNTDQGNTSHGMELILYDANGDIIDYQLTDDMNDFSGVSGDEYLGDGGCGFVYDNYFDGANGFNVQRMPDGTGCWPDGNWTSDTCIGTPTSPPPGNSANETTNTTNDILPSGTTDVPMIVIDNVDVTPGGDAVFTISIVGYYNLASEAVDTTRTSNEAANPIQITYDTYNSSAVAPDDYIAIIGDINTFLSIPSGASSATITVSTNGTAGVGEQFFARLTAVISSSTAPAMIDTFYGVATFIQGLDHYAISHSGTGITCEAESVTITAHDATDAATAPSNTTTITLSTTSTNGSSESWALNSGNGTFTAPNHYTFDGIESSVSFWYAQTSVETGIDIDVDDGVATDIDDGNNTNGKNAEDPSISFSDAGFRFYYDNAGTPTQGISTQIGGKPSSTTPGNALILRAIETNSDTGACAAGITGTQTVKLAYECVNPASCAASNELKLLGNATYNDATATTIERNDLASSPLTYSNVSLSFDASGSADISFLYNNVGALNLYAETTLTADAGTTPPTNATTLSGSSGNFIVRPFGYNVTATGNPGATDHTGSAYISAGTDFTVTTDAVLWDSADDTNHDGIPDGHNDIDPANNANLSDNTIASAYGSESIGTTIGLTGTLVGPAGGHDPGLTTSGTSTDIDTFSGGSGSNATIQFNEVGIIQIGALNADYLGSGTTIYGSTGYVGRFYADHFSLGLSAATFEPASDGFTYLGQPFSFSTPPDLVLTALSSNNGLLQNYEGDYWKLGTDITLNSGTCGVDAGFCYNPNGTTWTAATPYIIGDVIRSTTDNYIYVVTKAGTSGASEPVWGQSTTDGTVEYQRISASSPTSSISFGDTTNAGGSITLTSLHSGGSFIYSKPVLPVGPFDADLLLQILLQDSDGASGNTSLTNIGFNNDSDPGPYTTTNDSLLRYGRATITDTTTAGTVLGTTADVPFVIQYYDGTAFIFNSDDISTSVVHSSGTPAFTCTDPDTSNDTLVCAGVGIAYNTKVNNTTFPFVLVGDINDNGGTLVYDLENTVLPSFLQYDWDEDGTLEATDKARAAVTFGPPSYYHGDSRFIYWREQNR